MCNSQLQGGVPLQNKGQLIYEQSQLIQNKDQPLLGQFPNGKDIGGLLQNQLTKTQNELYQINSIQNPIANILLAQPRTNPFIGQVRNPQDKLNGPNEQFNKR